MHENNNVKNVITSYQLIQALFQQLGYQLHHNNLNSGFPKSKQKQTKWRDEFSVQVMLQTVSSFYWN